MIAIIDYKAGNLASVKKAFDAVGAETAVTSDPELARRADKLVLPGVGHFAATAELSRAGMKQVIEEHIAAERPFLGICVGMQWMLHGSTEAPETTGLGVFPSECRKFECPSFKVPHVGWNRIRQVKESRLLDGVEAESFVYYAHSYCAPVDGDTVAVTDYGETYSAVVENGHLFGVQFHPEKSGAVGLQILRNFVQL